MVGSLESRILVGKEPWYNLGREPCYNLGGEPWYNPGKEPWCNLGGEPWYNLGKEPWYNLGREPCYNLGRNLGNHISRLPLTFCSRGNCTATNESMFFSPAFCTGKPEPQSPERGIPAD